MNVGSDIMPRATPFAILVAVLMTSCGLEETLTKVDTAVQTFHNELDAGSYDQIYEAAHEGFRSAGTEAESAKFLGAIHEKLGNVKQARYSFFRAQRNAKRSQHGPRSFLRAGSAGVGRRD